MPPSVSRLELSASALSDVCQNSGSSFLARSMIAFWLAGEIFFQVSLLMVTIWRRPGVVGLVEELQELPELAVDARHRRGRHAGRRRPTPAPAMVSPHGISAGAMPMRAAHVLGVLVGHADLDALQRVERLGLDLEVQVLRRPRHHVEDGLVVLGRDLLELGPQYLCSTFSSSTLLRDEGNALDAEQRLVADLLDVEDVGHRHQPVAHGAQLLGALEAELTARLHVDLDGARWSLS